MLPALLDSAFFFVNYVKQPQQPPQRRFSVSSLLLPYLHSISPPLCSFSLCSLHFYKACQRLIPFKVPVLISAVLCVNLLVSLGKARPHWGFF